jgi:peptide/nickel transport system permease protein
MSFWGRYFSRWQNWIGASLALLFILVAVAAPAISAVDEKNPGPFKVVGRFTDPIPHPPGENPRAPLGTLPGQFDVLHTLVWGFRDALRFGLSVALSAFGFGVAFGAVSGYAGGSTNSVMMRIADAFLTFPPLIGAVLLNQLAGTAIIALGGQYFFNPTQSSTVLYFEGQLPPLVLFLDKVDPLLISLVLFSWMPYARLVNTLVISLRGADFVQSAQALGASPLWVIRRHLIPNSISPAVVLAARDVGSAVILQATMVMLNLGGNSPWGRLLAIGRQWITSGVLTFWWVYVPITATIVLFGVAWNLIGDGLSEALAPELRTAGARISLAVGVSSPRVPGAEAIQVRARNNAGPRGQRVLGMTVPQVVVLAELVILEILLLLGIIIYRFLTM